MDKIFNLFAMYGYTIESFGKSYIADNGKICIAFDMVRSDNPCEITAISFSAIDKDYIKNYYKNETYLGNKLYSDYMNNRINLVNTCDLCQYNLNLEGIRFWLDRINKIMKGI